MSLTDNPENRRDGYARAVRTPDPNLPRAALGTLFGLLPRLSELADSGDRRHGVTPARGRVLWQLRASGPSLMRTVSDGLGISPRTLTGLVDGLEADGWLLRKPHPRDRRATMLELTAEGRQWCDTLDDAFAAFATTVFRDVPVDDLRTFLRVLVDLRQHLDDAVG